MGGRGSGRIPGEIPATDRVAMDEAALTCKRLYDSSKMEDEVAKKSLVDDLYTCLLMGNVFRDALHTGRMTTDQLQAKNANSKLLMSILKALGVLKLKEDDEVTFTDNDTQDAQADRQDDA
jgi:hypothetical protein